MNITTKEKKILINLRNLKSLNEIEKCILMLEKNNNLLAKIIRFQYAFFHFNFELTFTLLKSIIPELFPYRIIQTKEKHLYSFVFTSIKINNQEEAYKMMIGLDEPFLQFKNANLVKTIITQYETTGSVNEVFNIHEKFNLKRDSISYINFEKTVLEKNPKLIRDYSNLNFATTLFNRAVDTRDIQLIKEVFTRTISAPHLPDDTLLASRMLAYNGDFDFALHILRSYVRWWSGEEFHTVLPVNLIYDPYLRDLINEDFLREIMLTPKEEYIIYKK